MSLAVTLLGTGTSTGVPQIGCSCRVCTSDDPRDRRLRAGVLLRVEADEAGGGGREGDGDGPGDGAAGPAGGTIVVDTSPDFRQHALTHGIRRLDAVLYTHSHADHVYGLDDVRVFNFLQRSDVPLYGARETLATIRRFYAYAFEPGEEGGGKPRLSLVPVREPFELLGRRIVPVPVWHGSTEVFGYRMGAFALVTDVNRVPDESLALLRDLDVLVLGALRHRPHATHFSVAEAVELAARIGARRTLLTHLSHEVHHADGSAALPQGVELAHDGLAFRVD